jgi:YD repeat-containing protein
MARIFLLCVSVIALLVPLGVKAAETVTYSYDAQGRLVQSVISGTVNNGQTSTTTFDAANNRTNYSVSVSGSTPPPPSNQPPVTVADSLSNIPKCVIRSKNVTANDSDPEGNVPLTVISVVSSNPSLGSASVANASTVQYESGISGGSDTVTYTVQDSLGAMSTGTLTVTVVNNGTCSGQQSATPPPSPEGE